MSDAGLANGGPSPVSTAKESLRVDLPAASVAENAGLVEHLTTFINYAFTTSEQGIWDLDKPKFERLTADKTRDLLRSRELAFVWRGDAPDIASALDKLGPPCVVGSVRLHWAEPQIGDVSLVACTNSVRGQGVGRAIMRFAEEHFKREGGKAVQIELLVPQAAPHPEKVKLDAWYQRLGFVPIRMEEFHLRYPHLAPLLAGECLLKVYEKPL